MCGRLSDRPECRKSAIVARSTIADNTRMIEYRRGECRIGVTDKTILARLHMQGGRILADCETTVVASLATAGDVRMDGTEKA